jgi:hypothetical protein
VCVCSALAADCAWRIADAVTHARFMGAADAHTDELVLTNILQVQYCASIRHPMCAGVASTAHQPSWGTVVERVRLRSDAGIVSDLLRDTSQSFATTQRPVRSHRHGAHAVLTIVHIYCMLVPWTLAEDVFVGGCQSSVYTQIENAHSRRWIAAACCTSRGRRFGRVARCVDCATG